jgi:hypothetical protein
MEMAEHQKTRQRKQEEGDQKQRTRQKNPELLVDQFHTWEQGISSLAETPFQPQMDAHAELLANARSGTQRAGLVIHLQQTYGNRYVQRLLNSKALQAKLTVSQPGDIYEQEADRVARIVTQKISYSKIQRQEEGGEEEEEVMPKPASEIQRQVPEEEEELQAKSLLQRQEEGEEEEEEVQMQPAGSQPVDVSQNLEARINAARGNGQPLSEDARVPMEQAFGADFSSVRVHTDSEAHGLSESLQARAFTTRQDIFFKNGEYSPGSDSGRKLIAHELTHVVQQGGGGTHGATHREDESAEVHGTLSRTVTIQRYNNKKRTMGKRTAKLVEAHEKHIKAAKGFKEETEAEPSGTQPQTPREEAEVPAAPPPPVPERITPLEPLMKLRYEERYARLAPVKEEKEKLDEELETKIMTVDTLQKRGEKPFLLRGLPDSTEYKTIQSELEKYHNLAKPKIDLTEVEDMTGRLGERLNLLDSFDTAIGNWWGRFGTTRKSRRKRREAIADLRNQVAAEKKRVNKVREALPGLVQQFTKPEEVTYMAKAGHYLEAYDPKHRDYNILLNWWNKWSDDMKVEWAVGLEPPPPAFFEWVDKEEEALLGQKKPIMSRTQYYTVKDRLRRELKFEGDKPFYKQSGEEFKAGIYVMSPGKEFYAQYEDQGTMKEYHHSTFLSGLPVAAAGHLEAKGKMNIDLESGHYQPQTRHMVNAVKGLEEKHGVNLDNVTVQPFAKEVYKAIQDMPAGKFKEELEQLKGGRLKELEQERENVKKGKTNLGDLVAEERRKGNRLFFIVLHSDRVPEAHTQLMDAVSAS